MGNYFIGKGVQLLTEESKNKIRIRKQFVQLAPECKNAVIRERAKLFF